MSHNSGFAVLKGQSRIAQVNHFCQNQCYVFASSETVSKDLSVLNTTVRLIQVIYCCLREIKKNTL